jgi:tetratricopeptide (TPR) repeat protein
MDDVKPKATLCQEVELARRLYALSTTPPSGNDDLTPASSILSDLRTQPLGAAQTLCSSKGISADWLLDVFFRLPFCQTLIQYGCELWFVRKVCINELLRRHNIHAGPLVDHVHVIQQQWAVASVADSQQQCCQQHSKKRKNESPPQYVNHHQPIVQDRATVFVSYTGRFLLQQFVELLQPLRGQYVWWDVLCIDQFAWTGRPNTIAVNDLRHQLIQDLPNQLRSIGRVVLFLERWDQIMHTLGQAWVLWEIYNAVIQTNVDFDIFMPRVEQEKYLQSLIAGHEHVRTILADIDCQQAQSDDVKARDLIVHRMEYAHFWRVNQVVTERVRQWYHTIGLAHCATATLTVVEHNQIDHLCFVHNLATLLYYHESFAVAQSLYARVVAISQQKYGLENEITLHFRHSLACLRHVQGEWDEANLLYGDVLQTQLHKLGPQHPDTLRSRHSLAMLRCHQSRWEEAAWLYTQALQGRRLILGPCHRDTLCTMHDLANVRHKQGRLDQATVLYWQSLAGQRQELGMQHPDTLCTLHNLARVRYDQGHWEEAESLYEQALEGQRQQLGDHHPHTLRSRRNLKIVSDNNQLRRQRRRDEEGRNLLDVLVEEALTGASGEELERPTIAIGPPTPGNAPFHTKSLHGTTVNL